MNTLAFLVGNPWIVSGGYTALFIIMLIDGGAALTIIVGFATRLGLLNLWIVLFLSMFGNVIPDMVFYFIGRLGRTSLIDKYRGRYGISDSKVKAIEKLYGENPISTLLVVKLIPFMAPVGLTSAGASRMSLRKYSSWILTLDLLTSVCFLALGYYFGEAYLHLATYQRYLALAAIGVAVFFIARGFNRLKAKLGDKLLPPELKKDGPGDAE